MTFCNNQECSEYLQAYLNDPDFDTNEKDECLCPSCGLASIVEEQYISMPDINEGWD